MFTTRIAAGATALILGVSGVGLTGEVQTETHTEVSAPPASAELGAETETNASVADSSPTTPASVTTVTSVATSTTEATTSVTVDDHPGTDDGDEGETSAVVTLNLGTHTAADAGTVTVDGMALIAVDPNPGWTVEIDESSSDRIRIEFKNGDREVEFELRVDGELRVRSES